VNVRDALGPIVLPPRLALRALEDLHRIALAASTASRSIVELQDRFDIVSAQVEQATTLLARIESMGQRVVVLGEQIDARAGLLLDLGERFDLRAGDILAEAGVMEERAREVAVAGAAIAAAIPLLERALQIAEPLEGAAERVGRIVDRLPGSARRGTVRRRAEDE
jgi:hypothetical protein